MNIPLQIEMAGSKLLDYGVLGLVLFGVCWFAWRLYAQQQKYTEEWRIEARESNKTLTEFGNKQLAIQDKQNEIQEKQLAQTKEFYDSVTKRVDEMPERIVREIEYKKLQDSQNNAHTTPAP